LNCLKIRRQTRLVTIIYILFVLNAYTFSANQSINIYSSIGIDMPLAIYKNMFIEYGLDKIIYKSIYNNNSNS
jgi:hypothetical protein